MAKKATFIQIAVRALPVNGKTHRGGRHDKAFKGGEYMLEGLIRVGVFQASQLRYIIAILATKIIYRNLPRYISKVLHN